MSLHHMYLMVPKVRAAAITEWYSKALEPINYHVKFTVSEKVAGIGPRDGWPNFWIRSHDGDKTVPTHVCFSVPS